MRSVACRSETGPPSPSLSRRASRPLPSPLSFTGISRSCCCRDAVPGEDLTRQGDIGLRAFAFAIERHGGRAEARRLGEPYVARNHGLVHFLAEVLLQLRRRSEEHTSELQSRRDLVCRLLLEKKKKNQKNSLDIVNLKTKTHMH